MFREFLEKLRAGDPVCVFVTAVVGVTSLAFTMASLAWWAEFGAELLLQSARYGRTGLSPIRDTVCPYKTRD